MPVRVQKRFVDTIASYLVAVEDEIKLRTTDGFESISVKEFIDLRRETSAVRTVLALMEFAIGLDLPDEVVEHPTLVGLVELANDQISWANVSSQVA